MDNERDVLSRNGRNQLPVVVLADCGAVTLQRTKQRVQDAVAAPLGCGQVRDPVQVADPRVALAPRLVLTLAVVGNPAGD